MWKIVPTPTVYKQFVLVTLSMWILSIQGENERGPTTNHVSPTRGRFTSFRPTFYADRQANKGQSAGSALALNTKSGVKNQDLLPEDEVIPTWVLVLIGVIVGFIMVACCLCAFKFYQWKKDQGTYSMWNDRELNVESMYARESGVLFEKLDIESSLYEDQCYEIPVDSFNTPQRIYIGGKRVTPVKEGIEESIKTTECRMSANAKRLASVSDTDYWAVTDRINRGADISSKAESMSESVHEDTSQRSSSSLSTRDSLPERTLSPTTECSAKESYCKPLPVIVGEPVTCETYELNTNNKHRFIALVNRPLPQTPPVGMPPPGSPPHVIDSWASLDRSLLKQQKEAELNKKVIFRTLPRPKKLKQLQAPLVNPVTKAASSNDVNKEIRVNDHVASDPHDCTLTKIKKRLSQSLDTLLATERVSHFYENPDLIPPENRIKEQQEFGGSEGTLEGTDERHYASASTPSINEDLPRDREHLYARISTVLDPSESNRHSYASIHYPFQTPSPVFNPRPKSRHTYISIIFGSAEAVFESSEDELAPAKESGIPKSHSCSDLSSIRRATTGDPDKPPRARMAGKNSYVNLAEMAEAGEIFAPTKFSSPRSSTNEHDSSPTKGERVKNLSTNDTLDKNFNNNNLISFDAKCPYVNVNEVLEVSLTQNSSCLPTESSISTNGTLNEHFYQNSSTCNGDSSYISDKSDSTIENSTRPDERHSGRALSESSGHDTASSDFNESYYGVPKTPAIPLKRVNEILGKSGNESERNIQVYKKVNGVEKDGVEENADNHVKTLSTYLEERFVDGNLKCDEDALPEVTGLNEELPEVAGLNEEHIYENYNSRNRQSFASQDSLASSLSTDDKENESIPLINRRAHADVNGNDVKHGGKLELRGDDTTDSALTGESHA